MFWAIFGQQSPATYRNMPEFVPGGRSALPPVLCLAAEFGNRDHARRGCDLARGADA
jgi:hypothetical protein